MNEGVGWGGRGGVRTSKLAEITDFETRVQKTRIGIVLRTHDFCGPTSDSCTRIYCPSRKHVRSFLGVFGAVGKSTLRACKRSNSKMGIGLASLVKLAGKIAREEVEAGRTG